MLYNLKTHIFEQILIDVFTIFQIRLLTSLISFFKEEFIFL